MATNASASFSVTRAASLDATSASHSYLKNLQPWEFKVADKYFLRGYFTPPTGKPVLHFIHGNGFCGLTFEVLLSYLQDDFDLFISDAQGHGESDAGASYEGWNVSAKRFADVWDEHRAKWSSVPKIALGHSYGAIMTTLMLSRRADLFDMAVLMDPVYAPPRMVYTMNALSSIGLMKNMPLARQARIRTQSWDSYQATWDYLYQRGTFKGWDDRCLKSYIDHALSHDEDGATHLKCPPSIEAAIFSAYAKGLWPAIKRITTPITMMYGERTYPFVRQSRSKIFSSNLNYDFIRMPGGHCFMQEDPELSAQEIKHKINLQRHYIGA